MKKMTHIALSLMLLGFVSLSLAGCPKSDKMMMNEKMIDRVQSDMQG